MTSDQPVSPDLPEPTPTPEPDKPQPDKRSQLEPQPTYTRAAALWSALIMGFLVLIVLLVFIAQNTASAEFAFLSWRWSLPLGVAILGAAVAGGLLTVAAGTARIFQLRRAAKKNLKAARGG